MNGISLLATLFSISSTLVVIEEEEKECKWMCKGLLNDYNELLINSDIGDNLTAITEELTDACIQDFEFAKYVGDPVDTACPDFCEKLISVILKDEKLRNDLLQPPANAETMNEFCDKYDYSTKK